MPQPPLAFDPANILLAPGPSRIDLAVARDPVSGMKTGMVTMRTGSTTVTAILTGAQLREWHDEIGKLADEVNGTLATATMADVVTLGQQRR